MGKKLLFVGWYPNPVEKYMNVFFQNLIFALADRGNDCTVISPVSIIRYKTKIKCIPYNTVNITPKGNKVRVIYPKVLSASSKQIGKFNTEIITERLFEKGALNVVKKLNEKFDAVYGHFFLYGGLAAIKIGRLLNIPSFVAFGECDYETQVQKTYGDLQKKDVDGVSGIIAVSTKNAMVLDKLGLFKNIPTIIAPNAVDISIFNKKSREECRKEFNLPENKFIVGFVGGFIPRKGDKRLLAAVNQLEDVYLAFAGRGNDKPSGEKVLYCNALEHNDISRFLNAVDIFCLPTLSEGSCNAVMEALACGIPVISSDLPFNHDVLRIDNSIMVNPNSITEISNAIKKLKDNNNYRQTIAENGFATAQEFRIEERARKIESFMFNIINKFN